jgi:hypothetical protein
MTCMAVSVLASRMGRTGTCPKTGNRPGRRWLHTGILTEKRRGMKLMLVGLFVLTPQHGDHEMIIG